MRPCHAAANGLPTEPTLAAPASDPTVRPSSPTTPCQCPPPTVVGTGRHPAARRHDAGPLRAHDPLGSTSRAPNDYRHGPPRAYRGTPLPPIVARPPRGNTVVPRQPSITPKEARFPLGGTCGTPPAGCRCGVLRGAKRPQRLLQAAAEGVEGLAAAHHHSGVLEAGARDDPAPAPGARRYGAPAVRSSADALEPVT